MRCVQEPRGWGNSFWRTVGPPAPRYPSLLPMWRKAPRPRLEGEDPAHSARSQLCAASCWVQMCVLVVQLTEQVSRYPPPHPTSATVPTLPSALSREALSTEHFPPVSGVSTGLSPASPDCRLALASWERHGKAAGLASRHPRPVFPSVSPRHSKRNPLLFPAHHVRFPAIRRPTAEPTPRTWGLVTPAPWVPISVSVRLGMLVSSGPSNAAQQTLQSAVSKTTEGQCSAGSPPPRAGGSPSA